MNLPAANPSSGLPSDVRFDGPQITPKATLMCFTDLISKSSFSIKAEDATPHRVRIETALTRGRFFGALMPSRSEVAAACFAPVVALLLCCHAEATPTRPIDKPLPKISREIVDDYLRYIDGGSASSTSSNSKTAP